MKTILRLLCITGVVFISLSATANRHIDSLITTIDSAGLNKTHIETLLEFSYSYAYREPLKGISYITKADSLSKLIELDKGTLGTIQQYYSIIYNELSQHDKALYHINQSILLYKSDNLTVREALSNLQKGMIYKGMGKFDLAHQTLQESESLFNKKGGITYIGHVNIELGNLMSEIGDVDKAIEYYQKAREICSENPSTNCWETASTNIAAMYKAKNMPQEALGIFFEFVEEYKKNDPYGKLGKLYQNIADVYYELYGDHVKSVEYSKKALEECLKTGKEADIAESRLYLGRSLIHLNKYDEASYQLTEGLKIANRIDHILWISEIHNSLAELYDATGEYRNAYLSMTIHKDLKDSIKNIDIQNKINEIETKYETEKKEQEIVLLESDKKFASQELSSQKKLTLLSLLGVLMMGTLSIFLYRLFSQNRLQKQELQQAVKDKDYLLREIHHRVKNNLQVISSLLYLQSEKLTDPAAQDAINVGRGRVKSMALIHQNLYGVNQTSDISLQKYLEDLSIELFDSYNVRGQEIQLETEIEDTIVDVDILIPLGLIINELISNSLKYAFHNRASGIIKVEAKQDANSLSIIVKDDGVGINKMLVSKDSFGTELIESFVSQLNAEMKTDSLNGTAVNITIPYNKAA